MTRVLLSSHKLLFFALVAATMVPLLLPAAAEASCGAIKSTKQKLACVVGQADALEAGLLDAQADIAAAQADIDALTADLAAAEDWIATLEAWLGDDIDPRLTLVEDDYLTGANLDGYATETWVDLQIAAVDHSAYLVAADLAPYATRVWVDGRGYLVSADLVGYATEGYVDSSIASVDHSAYLVAADLAPYATEVWVDGRGFLVSADLSGYATEPWVDGQIAAVDHSAYLTSSDLSGFATEPWVEGQGYVSSVDVSGFATETWVVDQGYLSSVDLDALEADVVDNTAAIALNEADITDNAVAIAAIEGDYASTVELETAVCPGVAWAGLDQLVATNAVCTIDAYGDPTCSTCEATFELNGGDSVTTAGTSFGWTIVSGTGALSDGTTPWPTVDVAVTPPSDDMIVTEEVAVQLSITDYCGDTVTDTVLLTLECTAPAAP